MAAFFNIFRIWHDRRQVLPIDAVPLTDRAPRVPAVFERDEYIAAHVLCDGHRLLRLGSPNEDAHTRDMRLARRPFTDIDVVRPAAIRVRAAGRQPGTAEKHTPLAVARVCLADAMH